MNLRCVALLYALLAIQHKAASQQNKSITLMDFVKIKDGKKAEAMYFYENNWKLYREEALKRKIIQSYQVMETMPDSLNNFDLILITVYKDSAQYSKSEENFRPLLATLRPNGPVLLNNVKPADFRVNLFFKTTHTLFTSAKRNTDE